MKNVLMLLLVLFVGDAAATVYSCSGGKIKIGALQTKMVQAKTCIGGTSVTYTCTGGTGMTSTVVPHAPDCRPGSHAVDVTYKLSPDNFESAMLTSAFIDPVDLSCTGNTCVLVVLESTVGLGFSKTLSKSSDSSKKKQLSEFLAKNYSGYERVESRMTDKGWEFIVKF